MKIREAGVYVYMCWRRLSRWGSFAAVILTVCFIAISSSSSSDATGEEALPVPLYYYIKELTSTYTHTHKHLVSHLWKQQACLSANFHPHWSICSQLIYRRDQCLCLWAEANLFLSLNTKGSCLVIIPFDLPVVLPIKRIKGQIYMCLLVCR